MPQKPGLPDLRISFTTKKATIKLRNMLDKVDIQNVIRSKRLQCFGHLVTTILEYQVLWPVCRGGQRKKCLNNVTKILKLCRVTTDSKSENQEDSSSINVCFMNLFLALLIHTIITHHLPKKHLWQFLK